MSLTAEEKRLIQEVHNGVGALVRDAPHVTPEKLARLAGMNLTGTASFLRALHHTTQQMRSKKPRPTIQMAVIDHDVAGVRALLKYEANPNEPDCNYMTPLITAAAESQVEIARVLLEAKADPRLEDVQGQTALDCAAHQGCMDIVDLLAQTPENFTALQWGRALFRAHPDKKEAVAACLARHKRPDHDAIAADVRDHPEKYDYQKVVGVEVSIGQ